MKQSKPFVAVMCVLLMAAAPGMFAQQLNDRGPQLDTERSHWYSGFAKPYATRYLPPINISNSGRADSLIRAGNLYLSLSDAIALALENNIDVEVARYGYPLNESGLRAARAGNGVVNYDPVFTSAINWGRNANIGTNNIISGGVPVTVGDTQTRNFGIQQGFETGGTLTLGFNNNSATTNSPNINFNPSLSTQLNLQGTQPLLQGFGLAFNTRNIRVAKNNIRLND